MSPKLVGESACFGPALESPQSVCMTLVEFNTDYCGTFLCTHALAVRALTLLLTASGLIGSLLYEFATPTHPLQNFVADAVEK